MKTVWNLTEYTELEEPVLTAYATPQRRRGQKAPSVLVEVVMTVAAMATTVAITPQANVPFFTVPSAVAVVAHSGTQHAPPLQSLFSGRFDAEWSQSKENALLASLEERAKEYTKEEREKQIVESSYFNQQEDVSEGPVKLSREEIRKLLRQRRLV